MKFGLLTQWFDPEPGPASLPGGLARELVARGHSVQVVTGFPNYPTGQIMGGYRQCRYTDEVDAGVHIRRVALYPSHDGSAAKRMLNYGSFAASSWASGIPALADVDALWVNYSPVTIGLPMFAAQRRWHLPTVVHVLDLWPDTLFASGFASASRSGRAAERALTRWCDAMYGSAESVAYISPGVGDMLAARGVPEGKLAYAPMWADEELFSPMPVSEARGWDLGPGEVTLVYAGTLGGAQGLETLIRACARVTDLRFRCLIAGSGVLEDELRSLAASAGATNVRFLGRLPKHEIGGLMAAGDVHYVGLNDHPLARTTMPSKLQATLASARPVIGSLMGDAAAVVERSGAGWIATPGQLDELVAVIRRACARGRTGLAELGTQARSYYDSEFSRSVGVDRIEDLLTRSTRRATA